MEFHEGLLASSHINPRLDGHRILTKNMAASSKRREFPSLVKSGSFPPPRPENWAAIG